MRRLLFVFLAVAAIFWWLGRLLGRGRRGPAQGRPSGAAPPAGPMVRDRVCNTFLPRSRALTLQVGSEQEFFCSERCRQTFLRGSPAGG